MLVIRLFRTGKKNQPFFKIVVTDKKRAPKSGSFIEEAGFYNPLTKEKKLKTERVKYWLSVGAKPSDTVYNLLIKERILEGKKIPLHKKKKEKKETVGLAPAGAPARVPTQEKSSPAPVNENKPVEIKPVNEIKAEKSTEKPITEEKPKEEKQKTEEKPKTENPKKEETPTTGLDK